MRILEAVYNAVWGVPALILILGVGVFLSVRTRFVQLRWLPKALKLFALRMSGKSDPQTGVSSFQAMCTALAATVGTGNLAGVAGAIAIGGPGAVFWMWICGILGMMIKFAEATLAVRFRMKNESGEYVGGPMYIIRRALGKRFHFLAGVYAFFGVAAAFGVGNATQVNTVITSLSDTLSQFGLAMHPGVRLLIGLGLAVLIAGMLLGGARRIGSIAERLVPFGAIVYLLLGILVLILRCDAIGAAFSSILIGACSPDAVTGGAVGSALTALRIGVSRGVFTNEAGMGTASIAHAGADVQHPVEQGMMGIVEVFLDTIVICTITALVILVSGIDIPYGFDVGISLTNAAFSCVLGNWVGVVLSLSLCLFALATVLGWGLYGIRCAQYLFGDGVWRKFVFLQVAVVVIGAVVRAETIWLLAEILNGLMAIPNLIAILALMPELMSINRNYLNGGTYEDFNQCKSLRILPHAYVPPAGSGGQGAG